MKLSGLEGFEVTWADMRIIDTHLYSFRFEPGHLKETIEKEHGFVYPTPIILKGKLSLANLYTNNFTELYDVHQLLALTRDLAIEATHRGIDVSTKAVFDVDWDTFSTRKHVTCKVVKHFKYDLDLDIEEDYLYSWHRAGGYHGESWQNVGLVLSKLFICMQTSDIVLMWWERETSVMNRVALQEWFQQIMDAFNNSVLHFNEAILGYMKKAQDLADVVETNASDRTNHFYQNPVWETFWIEQGEIRTAKKVISCNKHPKSNKHLLATLDDNVNEEAVIKHILTDVLRMDQIMVNWPLVKENSNLAEQLTPISYWLICRWWMAEREQDEPERQILLKLAQGKLLEKLASTIEQLPSTQDRKRLSNYIEHELNKDMDLFLKFRNADPRY